MVRSFRVLDGLDVRKADGLAMLIVVRTSHGDAYKEKKVRKLHTSK